MSEQREQHTPGPWIDRDGTGIILASDGHEVLNSHQVAEVFKKADARLIAAAPELLAALQRMVAASDAQANGDAIRRLAGHGEAVAAIAKATGSAA